MATDHLHHDTGYKLLFSHPRLVEDLLKGFIQPGWLNQVDTSTLEPFKTSFVTDDLRQRHDDCIWRLRLKDQWVYLYLLIEFQSSDDYFMANRIMAYLGLLYQDIIRGQELKSGELLPPVFPIVIYNGRAPWKAPRQVAELIRSVHPTLTEFTPSLRYFLLQENLFNPDYTITNPDNLVGHLIALGQSSSPQQMRIAIQRLHSQLPSQQHKQLRQIFSIWISRMLKVKFKNDPIPEFQDLNEVDTMLSERIDDWMEDWKQKGLQEGRQEGLHEGLQQGLEQGLEQGKTLEARSLLLKLGQLKFGNLSEHIQNKLQTADLATLERWAESILTATTPDDWLS